MRAPCLITLAVAFAALLAVPVALAASSSPGDGTFAVKDVYGNVKVFARGAVWGQLDRGSLTITDANPTDGVVKVSGTEMTKTNRSDKTATYVGTNIHFQLVGGAFRLQIANSEGVDLSAVGIGKAMIAGDPFAAAGPGFYALADGKWQVVPFLPKALVFGLSAFPPVPTTTTTP